MHLSNIFHHKTNQMPYLEDSLLLSDFGVCTFSIRKTLVTKLDFILVCYKFYFGLKLSILIDLYTKHMGWNEAADGRSGMDRWDHNLKCDYRLIYFIFVIEQPLRATVRNKVLCFLKFCTLCYQIFPIENLLLKSIG